MHAVACQCRGAGQEAEHTGCLQGARRGACSQSTQFRRLTGRFSRSGDKRGGDDTEQDRRLADGHGALTPRPTFRQVGIPN